MVLETFLLGVRATGVGEGCVYVCVCVCGENVRIGRTRRENRYEKNNTTNGWYTMSAHMFPKTYEYI